MVRDLHHRYSWRTYLTLARDSNVKLEFFDGEIFAMAGGSLEHSAIATTIASHLVLQLEGKPYRAYNSDLRTRVLATGLATYPDVSVVCGKAEVDPEDKDTVCNPQVIVEVLSDSTEEYDRGKKFDNYKLIPSLREYVLVSQREPLIEVFRRGEEGHWNRVEARARASVRLESIGCELGVDRVYAGIDLHQAG